MKRYFKRLKEYMEELLGQCKCDNLLSLEVFMSFALWCEVF